MQSVKEVVLRKYKQQDCEEMAQLFYDTVHTVNAKDYEKKQLDVWATGTVDLEGWNESFLAHDTVVAMDNDRIVGFGIWMRRDIWIVCMYTKIIKERKSRQQSVIC